MSHFQWLIMRYGIFNLDIIHAAVKIAKQEGVFVSLDLASFEVNFSVSTSFLAAVQPSQCSYIQFKKLLKWVPLVK